MKTVTVNYLLAMAHAYGVPWCGALIVWFIAVGGVESESPVRDFWGTK